MAALPLRRGHTAAEFRLEKINDRLHILDELLIAYLNLDEVIRIIRKRTSPPALMKRWLE